MLKLPVDWGTLWLGGFCPVEALGGLPIRGADYAAHPPLDERLALPADAFLRTEVTLEAAEAAWSERLGGARVVLVRDAYRARRLMHQAAGIQPGEWVGVPANASHDLAESVKHHKALLRFLDFDAQLRLAHSTTRFIWTQVVGGLWQPQHALWLDCSDTLPTPGAAERPAVTLYGLHLPDADDRPGALLVFSDETLYAEVRALRQPADCPNAAQALAQCERLPELAEKQGANLAEVRRGLREAAGLVTYEPNRLALATGVAVQIPLESDIATFFAYVEQENTPVRWLPQIQPLHYAALGADGAADHRGTATNLARWLSVPVGPEYTLEEIKHGVLGIVKAAEYLGVRWRTNPAYAAEYASLMDRTYGAGHDAYRPLFALDEAIAAGD
ncbi:MAG: hypothetical protein OXF62_13430 [Caldilineaceae bacterium]|nr:hypothetical protein [Caldilineaceae bacterium]